MRSRHSPTLKNLYKSINMFQVEKKTCHRRENTNTTGLNKHTTLNFVSLREKPTQNLDVDLTE
jgi:hypothetical protein